MQLVDPQTLPQEIIKLIDASKEAQQHAYAPYSKYLVGASVMDENGNIFGGCNVENAAYLVTHAEASAISAMVMGGGKQIKAIACITKDGGSSCGDCRQKTWEFAKGDTNLPIYLIDESGTIKLTTIGELLPFAFEL